MRLFITFCLSFFYLLINGQETQRFYISGTDKDHSKTWDFYCSGGRKSGTWNKIEVPSQWELQGFGNYNYGYSQPKNAETGTYRTTFTAPKAWKGQSVKIVFEGVMTDTYVKLNGKSVGEKHQGGFYRFKYNITNVIKYGAENQLVVEVAKVSSDTSVNRAEIDADYWTFGGIFRPVYIEITPRPHIERVALDAKASGDFILEAFLENAKPGDQVTGQIFTLDGEKVGSPFATYISNEAREKVILKTHIENPKLWNAETPNLYKVEVSFHRNEQPIHSFTERFGFRTIEIRAHDGFYLNGKKIILKGVNRHSSWPESGRTLSREIHLKDIALIKEMNMNAVRMSHYPPDAEFLDLCDSLGLYVFDELAGWQKNYDEEVGRKLVRETVIRDVNHPSIIIWDNGNEGGWNRKLDDDFALYDPQKREVFHPWEKYSYWDAKHYPGFNYLTNASLYSDRIILPTEFLHGLYDGGLGAGLDDHWNLFMQHPNFAGGFLWVLADEGIVRTDWNDSIDANKNYYPDGIVGPHREKEASFYTVREIWCPVQIAQSIINNQFEGLLQLENRYNFTNLNACSFKWKLEALPSPFSVTDKLAEISGNVVPIDLAPGERGFLKLDLPADRSAFDRLSLSAFDPKGTEIFKWTWPLKMTGEQTVYQKEISTSEKISTEEKDSLLIVSSNGNRFTFNKNSGYLAGVKNNTNSYLLKNGPLQAGVSQKLTGFWSEINGDQLLVKASYKGEGNWMNVTWTFDNETPVRLDYQYSQNGEADFMGVTFDYPENDIKAMQWLGNGPYRVWKNRLKGNPFGVWKKAYNNSVTGETWEYPEFKGYHANLYWVKIETGKGTIFIQNLEPGVFLQMLRPQRPKYAGNENTQPPFPKGDIGFLNAISPIGDKFKTAFELGPQGGKNRQLNYEPIRGSLLFIFE
jgi:beta-galactosidase/beta-glucuronidase